MTNNRWRRAERLRTPEERRKHAISNLTAQLGLDNAELIKALERTVTNSDVTLDNIVGMKLEAIKRGEAIGVNVQQPTPKIKIDSTHEKPRVSKWQKINDTVERIYRRLTREN